MLCKKCGQKPSIRETNEYITILCKDQITIIYPDCKTKTITKKEYQPNYKRKQNANHQTRR